MPDPASVPDQRTSSVWVHCESAAASTRLVGAASSIVVHQLGVASESFWSKTMLAWLQIAVPAATPAFGRTLKVTEPSPAGGSTFGGRKPADGSSVDCPVAWSIESKRHVTIPVAVSSDASTVITTFWSGRRSTLPL